MDIRIRVNAATIAAAAAGELMSWFWFSESAPWGEHSSDRYILTAVVGTFGLAIVVQWIMGRFWNVRGVPEAAKLAGVLALAYLCLEIPHVYPGPGSLTHFFVHVAHKFTLVFIMALVLWGYRRYVEKKNY